MVAKSLSPFHSTQNHETRKHSVYQAEAHLVAASTAQPQKN